MGKTLLVNFGEREVVAGVLENHIITRASHIKIHDGFDDDERITALKKLGKILHFKNGAISLCVDDSECIMKEINVEDGEKITDVFLENKLIGHNEIDEEEYVFGYAERGTSKVTGYALLKSSVNEYQDIVKSAGFSLKSMLPESIALGNVIENSGRLHKGEMNAFINIGKKESSIRIYEGPYFVTSYVAENDEKYSRDNDYILLVGVIKKAMDYYIENGLINDASILFIYGEEDITPAFVNNLKAETMLPVKSIKTLINADIETKYAMQLALAYGACNCGNSMRASENLVKLSENFRVKPIRILGSVVGILLAVAFLYFGVVTRLLKTYELKNELTQTKSELSIIQKENEGYKYLEEDYLRFSKNYMTTDERKIADRSLTLDKVEKYLIRNSSVMKLALSDNEVVTTLYGVDMAGASYITNQMMSDNDGIIDYVSTGSANNSETNKSSNASGVASVEMKIELCDASASENNAKNEMKNLLEDSEMETQDEK